MSVSKLFTYITPIIAIDPGTDQTRVWSNILETDGNDGYISQATCLAVEKKTGKVIQIGNEAAAMEGRVGPEIAVVKPIRRGEVTDTAYLKAFLQMLLAEVVAKVSFSRPVMMLSVPSGLSVAKRTAVTTLLYDLGAKEVLTINQSLASAIGAGVPIADATGSFVMHCGAGGVEASVISLGSSVASDSTWYAGHWMDEYLQTHVLKEHGVMISMQVAKQLKEQALDLRYFDFVQNEVQNYQNFQTYYPKKAKNPSLGTEINGSVGANRKLEKSTRTNQTTQHNDLNDDPMQSVRLIGQDISTASPVDKQIDPRTILYPASLFFTQYELLLKRLLSQLPPELSVDVIDKGILLSGGFSQLTGFEEALRVSLGVPVSLVEDPANTVIKGLRTAVLHIDEFKQSIGYQV